MLLEGRRVHDTDKAHSVARERTGSVRVVLQQGERVQEGVEGVHRHPAVRLLDPEHGEDHAVVLQVLADGEVVQLLDSVSPQLLLGSDS